MTKIVDIYSVTHLSGDSKKTGNPYDFCQALIKTPAKSFSNAKSFGFDFLKHNIPLSEFEKLKGLSFPVSCTIEFDADLSTGKLQITQVNPNK